MKIPPIAYHVVTSTVSSRWGLYEESAIIRSRRTPKVIRNCAGQRIIMRTGRGFRGKTSNCQAQQDLEHALERAIRLNMELQEADPHPLRENLIRQQRRGIWNA